MFKHLYRKCTALVFLLAFTAQCFSQGIALVQFYVQRAYISKTQCINKFRPMLHCDGKCALARQLKQQEKKENQNPELRPEAKNEVLSSRSFFSTSPVCIVSTQQQYFSFSDNRTVDQPEEFFHPPGF